MIRMSKAQAAVEFISTYGWVLVMIVVAIAALSYLGVLTPITPGRCTLETGVSCTDFTIEESHVTLLLTNAKGQNIRIKSIDVEGCTGTDSGRLGIGEQKQFMISGCNIIDKRYKGEVRLVWSGKGGLDHTVFGTLAGNVLESLRAAEKREAVILELEPPVDIPFGKQRYRIRSTPQSPQIYEAIIDPLDVHVGDIQTMTVKVSDSETAITSVVAAIETDTRIRDYPLSLVSGDVWQGSWKVTDTHSRTYRTVFTATNSKGESAEAPLTWTDPCTPPASGEWELDDNCNVNKVQGIEQGNFNVTDAGMNIDDGGVLVFNPGYSIIHKPGAIMALADGAEIRKTYLWMGDQDGDSTPSNNTMFYGPEPPEGDSDKYRRRHFMKNSYHDYGARDCLDFGTGAANIFQDLSGVGNLSLIHI